jgi:hypothetical protein
MKRVSALMALLGFLTIGPLSTMALAADPAPAEQKDKKDTAAPKLSMDGDKKDEKKDKGGHVVFGDEKKDEKKGMGGK